MSIESDLRKDGIEVKAPIELDADEITALQESAKQLQEVYDSIQLS